MPRVPFLLYGATGRMGRAVRDCLGEAPELALVACVAPDRDEGPCPEGCTWLAPDALEGAKGLAALAPDLIVIDFSLAAGTERLIGALERAPRPLVSATTGLSVPVEDRVRGLSARVGVVRSTNLSVGVATVVRMLQAIPLAAHGAYEADVVEHHHATKRDAPSGTAVALARALTGGDPARIRAGAPATEARVPGEVRIHSVRSGTDPGEHRVVLAGAGETIELVHRAENRSIFAR
ncbi:MAG TPA: dihydrodipicolinate reductase C-terminal domain-containing protein [Candidatus Eisenbacteria bacterium]